MENLSDNFDRLQALLKIYTIKEIVSVFYNIDSKILSLHNCSSEDFLNLNNILRTHHAHAKAISEQTNKKLEEFVLYEKRKVFENLLLLHNNLVNKTNSFDKKLTSIIQSYEKTINQLEFLVVPLQNFKQNLITIKLLVTNLKLSITYHQSNFDSKTESEVGFLDDIIEQTKFIYSNVDENLLLLKGALKNNFGEFKKIHDQQLLSIKKENVNILRHIDNLEQRHKASVENLYLLSNLAENCFKNINEIVTNLQYQDIISQKMSHVQKSYKSLLDELNELDEENIYASLTKEQIEKLLQIPDVAELQVAQLIITNKEYQMAIENISKKTIEIGENITTMSALGMPMSIEDGDYKIDVENISKLYHFVYKQYNEIVDVKKNAQNNFNIIIKAIGFLTDNITNINCIDEKLELLIKKAKEILAHFGKNNIEHIAFLNQIENLSKDVNDIKNNVQIIFDQLLQQIKIIKTELNKMFNDEWFFDSILEKYSVIEPELNSYTKLLYEFKNENENAITESIEALKLSSFKIKYYEFFETVIEEIINELNTINCKIRLNTPSVDQEAKERNLKHIEQIYTMQSEREVHQRISTGMINSDAIRNQPVNQKGKDETGEIEFF